MNIVIRKCLIDCTCNECRKKLKTDIDERVLVITNNKDLILCKNCYDELVVKVNTIEIK